MPTDADRNNVYALTVRASDGALNEDRMVMVTVTDEGEGPDDHGRGQRLLRRERRRPRWRPSRRRTPRAARPSLGTLRRTGLTQTAMDL